MLRLVFAILFSIPLSLLLAVSPASSRDLDQDEALRLSREHKIMSLEQLLKTIAHLHPKAQLLEVELEEHHGQYQYDIDLLTAEGVARELTLNARTGDLISDEEDD